MNSGLYVKFILSFLGVYCLVSVDPIWAQNPTPSFPSTCSRLLGAAKNFIRGSRNEETIERSYQALRLIRKWEKVPESEITSNIEKRIFLQISDAAQAPFGVVGLLKHATILDDGVVLLISDHKNRWHVVDTARSGIQIRRLPQDRPADIEFVSNLNDDFFFHTELKSFDPLLSNGSLDLDKMLESLRSSPQALSQEQIERIRTAYRKISTMASVALVTTSFLWGGTYLARALGYGIDSFLMQHSSNFYMSLAGMAASHSTFSAEYPEKRGLLLSAAVWGAIAFNVGTEIFGQDWLDMATGVFAAGLYYSVVGLFESQIANKRLEVDISTNQKRQL